MARLPGEAGSSSLLLRQRQREFAVANAGREIFDEFRDRVFAIGRDQFGECGEQAGLRQAVAVDAVVPRFGPSLVELAERSLLLFVVGKRIAGDREGRGMAHETQRNLCALQGGTRRTPKAVARGAVGGRHIFRKG